MNELVYRNLSEDGDRFSLTVKACGFDLVSGNTDLIPGCFECLAAIVVIGVDGIAVSH